MLRKSHRLVAHPSVSGRWKEQQETAKFARERISFHVLFYVLCESLDPLFTDVQIRLINLTVVSWFLESRRSLLANLKFGSKVFHKASTYKSNINRNSSLSSEEYFPVMNNCWIIKISTILCAIHNSWTWSNFSRIIIIFFTEISFLFRFI